MSCVRWWMTNLDGVYSTLKSKDITPLLTKVHRLKAMVSSVVRYSCESWTIKEGWVPKNWCFWIVVLEKTLESPLDCKEIKLVNPKGNQPEIFNEMCWSWSYNTLATWCEELTHWKRPWYWGRMKAEGEEGGREWDGWIASLMQWT